jgi:hypothetical protein
MVAVAVVVTEQSYSSEEVESMIDGRVVDAEVVPYCWMNKTPVHDQGCNGKVQCCHWDNPFAADTVVHWSAIEDKGTGLNIHFVAVETELV